MLRPAAGIYGALSRPCSTAPVEAHLEAAATGEHRSLPGMREPCPSKAQKGQGQGRRDHSLPMMVLGDRLSAQPLMNRCRMSTAHAMKALAALWSLRLSEPAAALLFASLFVSSAIGLPLMITRRNAKAPCCLSRSLTAPAPATSPAALCTFDTWHNSSPPTMHLHIFLSYCYCHMGQNHIKLNTNNPF